MAIVRPAPHALSVKLPGLISLAAAAELLDVALVDVRFLGVVGELHIIEAQVPFIQVLAYWLRHHAPPDDDGLAGVLARI